MKKYTLALCIVMFPLIVFGQNSALRTMSLYELEAMRDSVNKTLSEEILFRKDSVNQKLYKVAYLNLSLYGIPAVIVHGNTITLDEYDRWYTPAYLWGKWVWRAPMPFGEDGYVSDEMLKRIDEPMYGALRQLEPLFSPVGANSTADAAKNT